MGDAVNLVIEEGGLAVVTLDRPEVKNAWNLPMFEGLTATAARLAETPGLRAVILRGAGGAFSSGLDLAVMQSFAGNLAAVKADMLNVPAGEPNRFQAPCIGWSRLPVPVIAAIEGVAYGAGLQLALAADFRIATPEARLSVREAHWGLIPDMGISQNLPRLMRADQALELIMTGRVLAAEEALALGLLTRIAADPLAAARALAAAIADRSPDAVRAAKTLVQEAWTLPPGAGLAVEARLQAALLGGPNMIEAVMANMQKRKPVFR
ncbi:MAG: crotonase/enoyl-CoA hydratase family protein [Rhodobacteraceae bacterium]|nr:crotonase/enoyl-CoA hydratase family protein [Paracoccaceae bacterium]